MAVTIPDLIQLQQMEARYAPVEMRVDISGLPAGDRQALVKLVEAARLIDYISRLKLAISRPLRAGFSMSAAD